MKRRKAMADRFEEKIFYGLDGCWYWLSDITSRGYGRFSVCGKAVFAHRFAYLLYKNIDPGNSFVCHACDNRACVNPNHMFLGSALDNRNDMVFKNRKSTKLNLETARQIRGSGECKKALAEFFNVSLATIHHIKTNKTWKII